MVVYTGGLTFRQKTMGLRMGKTLKLMELESGKQIQSPWSCTWVKTFANQVPTWVWFGNIQRRFIFWPWASMLYASYRKAVVWLLDKESVVLGKAMLDQQLADGICLLVDWHRTCLDGFHFPLQVWWESHGPIWHLDQNVFGWPGFSWCP